MTVYILCGGEGSRIWPFAECRNKAMLPVANEPVVKVTAEACLASGADRVVIVGWHMMSDIKGLFVGNDKVTVIESGKTRGSAETLAVAAKAVAPTGETFAVLFGDCLYDPADIAALLSSNSYTALVSNSFDSDDKADFLSINAENGIVEGFSAHTPYGSYRLLEGFTAEADFIAYAECAPEFYPKVSVGAMPAHERLVESAIYTYGENRRPFVALQAGGYFVDMDKPWLILEANWVRANAITEAITENSLAYGASIDPSAVINGFVRLGKNSRIGRNCTINGNIWVGDNTVIDNGAIIDGEAVIGNGCAIENFCYIAGGSVIGNYCKVLHCAEFEGTLMDKAYLYHYMEIEGLLGKNVDIGASCVCGTLRFDDRNARHKVRGRTETPRNFSNGVFIGDYSRTGVNCTFYPGTYIGCNSAVGPGVVVTENIPSRTRVLIRQDLVTSPWGPEYYGW
ncbi:MAG: NTP transferase domain-containing protein [Clostridia bacterium]|nr:NTP transferase domain-containing protein [Clostridia bacterium]